MTEEVKTDPPRDDKGKFVPKEKIIVEEKIIEKLDESARAILEGLDAELKEKLGDEIYEDYKDYKLQERIKHLQSVLKSVEKFEMKSKGKTIDKKGEVEKNEPPPPPPAPKYEPIKTLAELNDDSVFNRQYTKGSSFLNRSLKMRE